MKRLKTHEEFLNENLVGEYNYYGPSSLWAIVRKLVSEGKSETIIRSYLISLGVPRDRIQTAINLCIPQQQEAPSAAYVPESNEEVNEDEDTLIGTDLEDELDSDKPSVDTDKDDSEDDEEKDKEEDGDDPDKMVDALKDMADSKKKLDKIKAILKESKKS